MLLVSGCGNESTAPGSVPSVPLASATASPEPSAELRRVVFPGSFSPVGVAFREVQAGFVVGSTDGVGGDVGVTRDGGTTWTWTRLGKNPITRVAVSGDDAWVLSPCPDDVRCASALYRSRDLGTSWKQVTAKGNGLIGVTTVSFAGEHGWAIGFRGAAGAGTDPDGMRLRETNDGGRTWVERPDPCARWWPLLTDVQFVSARHGWLLCSGQGSGTMGPAAVFESVDGGATWALRSANGFFGGPSAGVAPGGPVEGLAMSAGAAGWVWQGRSGTARTGDAGGTWTNAPPGKPEEVFVSSMSVLNDDTAFAIVFDGERGVTGIIGTDDAGVTWHDVAVQAIDP
jgi:photosystem II stability/assembly factor-like uncharacterized protein